MRCPSIEYLKHHRSKYTGRRNRLFRLLRTSLKVQHVVPRVANRGIDNLPLEAEFINIFIEKRQ